MPERDERLPPFPSRQGSHYIPPPRDAGNSATKTTRRVEGGAGACWEGLDVTTVSHPGARGARYEYGTVYATSTVFAVVTAAAARMADMCAAVAGYTASGGAPVQIAAEPERLPPASCARWAEERVRVHTFAAILRQNGNAVAQKSAVTQGV